MFRVAYASHQKQSLIIHFVCSLFTTITALAMCEQNVKIIAFVNPTPNLLSSWLMKHLCAALALGLMELSGRAEGDSFTVSFFISYREQVSSLTKSLFQLTMDGVLKAF